MGHPQASFELSMYGLGDYDHDGRPDLAVGVNYNGLNGHFGEAIQIYSVPGPGGLSLVVAMGCGVGTRGRHGSLKKFTRL